MPPKGRKGSSAITKDEKVEKIDSDVDSEKDPVEDKLSPSTKDISKEEDEDVSNEDVANSGDDDDAEKKREVKKKSYKEETDEEEAVPKKRQSARSTKPKAKMVDVSDEDFDEEDEEESEDEYVPPVASPRGRGSRSAQKKRKGDDSDDSGSYGKKAKRPSKKPKRKPKKKDDSDFSEEDDSDEDWGSKKSKSRGGGRSRKASAPPTRRGERATRGRQNYAEDDDDDSDGPAPKAKSRAKSEDKPKPVEAKSEGEDDQEGSGADDEVKDGDSKQANGRKDKGKAVDSENGMVEEPEEEDDDEKEESKPAIKRKGEKIEKTPAKKVKETPDLSTVDFSCEKKTLDGKPWNLKISSWNVAGIRALIKKNGLEYITAEKPDIICLQETKCPEKKLPSETKIEGYLTYWNSGDKDGHNGLGLYTKEKPLEVTYSIGDPEFDSEGRVITAEYEKFYVVNAYVPNSGRGLVTLPKRLKWDTQFREYLKKLDEKKPVILCGDLNVSHQPIDLANPKTNTKNAGFTQEERDGFTKLLEEGFVDSFRQLYPDKTDAYTFWTNMRNARERNVGWRLDYFVLSKRLIPNLCENSIRSQVYGSDHCPLTLFINI